MSPVLTPQLCKAARILLSWSQDELARRSGVSVRTLTRFENENENPSPKVRDKLHRAFSNADIQFIASNTDDGEIDGLGVRWKPRTPHNGIKVI
jgi:transcriptional regulator with XRE-family HTH domain